MARRKGTDLRYTVDGSDKSYAEVGQALSLSVTLAARAMSAGVERTFYVRDSITGDTKGYSEVIEDGGRFVVQTRGISRT
jgi:hypothetical protein